MKFKVFFLKKKYIYYAIFAVIVLIALIVVLCTRKATQTFSNTSDKNVIKADFTGDGKEDTLYINTNKDKYFIEVGTNDTSVALEPNDKLNSLGNYYSYWPMRLTVMDISRDKIPEIFIQASEKDTPLQHVFCWDNGKFKDVFCSSNNIMGFLDSQNNQTPKFISGNINNNKINFSNYIMIKGAIKSYAINYKDNFIGKDTVLSFIKYIETLPAGETQMPKNVFSDDMTGKDIGIIGKLSAENSKFTFEDGFFTDAKYNKDGDISEVKWTLNFKSNPTADKSNSKCCTIKVLLKSNFQSDSSNSFKIYSMTVQ